MATFTMELWEVLEYTDDPGDGSLIGLGIYPIFDESYREKLNRKIIEHFWNREIGQETVSMFQLALSRRMNEIMPYWNQIYETTLTKIDPFSTVNLKTLRDDQTDEDASQTGKGNGTATSTTGGRTVNSDTPQTMLSEDEDYATSGSDVNSVAKTDNTSSTDSTSKSSAKASGSSTTSGYQGSQADLLTKLRSTLLNVDMLVIDQLTDCFMLIWDNGQEMLPNGFGRYGIGMGF